MNIFEKASRNKLRFETTKGQLSIEELWDLSLRSLDEMAMKIRKRIKEQDTEESLLTSNKSKNKEEYDDSLRFEILKHIIEAKEKEDSDAKSKADRQSQINFLESLLEKKEMQKLEDMNIDDIKAQLAQLTN